MTAKVVKCTCKHEYQDKLYGAGNRVANEMRSGQLKCSVCSAVLGSQNVTQARPAKEPVAEQPAKKKEESSAKPEKKKSLKGGKR